MNNYDLKGLAADFDDIAVKILALVPYEGESFHRMQTDLFKRLHALARALEGGGNG